MLGTESENVLYVSVRITNILQINPLSVKLQELF